MTLLIVDCLLSSLAIAMWFQETTLTSLDRGPSPRTWRPDVTLQGLV